LEVTKSGDGSLAFHIFVTIQSPDQSRSGYSDGYRFNAWLAADTRDE